MSVPVKTATKMFLAALHGSGTGHRGRAHRGRGRGRAHRWRGRGREGGHGTVHQGRVERGHQGRGRAHTSERGGRGSRPQTTADINPVSSCNMSFSAVLLPLLSSQGLYPNAKSHPPIYPSILELRALEDLHVSSTWSSSPSRTAPVPTPPTHSAPTPSPTPPPAPP